MTRPVKQTRRDGVTQTYHKGKAPRPPANGTAQAQAEARAAESWAAAALRTTQSAFTATKGWADSVGIAPTPKNEKATYLDRVKDFISRIPHPWKKGIEIETVADDRSALERQWARRIEQGRDPVTGQLPSGEDEFGLIDGLDENGNPPFGAVPWMRRAGVFYDEREFDYQGIHKETGTRYNKFGIDARGWMSPLTEDIFGVGFEGQRLHALTGTVFAPRTRAHAGKTWEGLSRDEHFAKYAHLVPGA